MKGAMVALSSFQNLHGPAPLSRFQKLNFKFFIFLNLKPKLYNLSKTNVSSANNLALYPFEIQPSIFELHKGDVFALEIIFKPPDVKKYEQDIVITCDNCTTIEFKLVGEGELAQIEYIQQDEDMANVITESSVLIDEYKDILSNKIIRFPALNPNVYTRKRFAIKNRS